MGAMMEKGYMKGLRESCLKEPDLTFYDGIFRCKALLDAAGSKGVSVKELADGYFLRMHAAGRYEQRALEKIIRIYEEEDHSLKGRIFSILRQSRRGLSDYAASGVGCGAVQDASGTYAHDSMGASGMPLTKRLSARELDITHLVNALTGERASAYAFVRIYKSIKKRDFVRGAINFWDRSMLTPSVYDAFIRFLQNPVKK